jgi:hypothetical protein
MIVLPGIKAVSQLSRCHLDARGAAGYHLKVSTVRPSC